VSRRGKEDEALRGEVREGHTVVEIDIEKLHPLLHPRVGKEGIK